MVRLMLSALMLPVLLAGAALAQEASPPPPGPPASPPASPPPAATPMPPAPLDRGDSRYTVHRVQDTLVRLDGRTGQVSVCSKAAAGWSCQTVPDDRQALESEIARLQAENVTLKKELLSRNLPLPDGVRPPSAASNEPPATAPRSTTPGVPETRLPTEAELDRVMAFLTKAWRRMIEMMAEVQRDMDRKNPDPNKSDRNSPDNKSGRPN